MIVLFLFFFFVVYACDGEASMRLCVCLSVPARASRRNWLVGYFISASSQCTDDNGSKVIWPALLGGRLG